MYANGPRFSASAHNMFVFPSFLFLLACGAESTPPAQVTSIVEAPAAVVTPPPVVQALPDWLRPIAAASAPSYTQMLVQPSTGDGGGIFRPDGVGAFRITCRYSHMAFDDPIVYPGRPGASHLHVFFGNAGADAYSTSDSIANTGGSTCAGGIANRSAYWVPAMVDERTLRAIAPTHIGVYYKTHSGGASPASPASVQLPKGIRFVFGHKMDQATRVDPWWDRAGHFHCRDMTRNGESYIDTDVQIAGLSWAGDEQSIPNCRVGDELIMHITGPHCWDGVNLDSPDHRSHVTRRVADDPCPASHPVNIPVLSYVVTYQVKAGDDTRHWRLSSDKPSSSGIKAGYTMHGDYWEGWDRPTLDAVLDTCLRIGKDCHQDLLGDGRWLSFPN